MKPRSGVEFQKSVPAQDSWYQEDPHLFSLGKMLGSYYNIRKLMRKFPEFPQTLPEQMEIINTAYNYNPENLKELGENEKNVRGFSRRLYIEAEQLRMLDERQAVEELRELQKNCPNLTLKIGAYEVCRELGVPHLDNKFRGNDIVAVFLLRHQPPSRSKFYRMHYFGRAIHPDMRRRAMMPDLHSMLEQMAHNFEDHYNEGRTSHIDERTNQRVIENAHPQDIIVEPYTTSHMGW